ncbi:D-amino acid dehydrogenase [Roseicyclus sp. F158]|uniref:D-amino acid dehydrogenase n=1 Tax=Tropicimonas omnivorans TaxID=3075590 RepID=A0ABU3DL75_9RHOB|nr:D-amino acid dehydrogenase [Roseicyclus sp. F158]MDT0684358.1 D-amino acid dehydrogenase [Roseicyclus sp. F158]
MRVIVIGAGIVGIASAWYLTKDGHDVTVLERREGPAEETSFGNAGGVCPGFAGPWAAPGMPLKALRWMFRDEAPLKIRPSLEPARLSWLAQFTRNCTSDRFAANKAAMQRIAHFSKACLQELRAETGISYDHGTGGVVQVFSTRDEMEAGRRSAEILDRLDIPHRLLGSDELTAAEPGLARSEVDFTGGLHLTTDETGDCHLFCEALARLAAEAGCTFRYGVDAASIDRAEGRASGVRLRDGEQLGADAVVVATGPWARELLDPLGIRVPVYPVKGYSMSVEIGEDAFAPASSVMDEHSKVMITRLGSRIRAAGVAEIAGFDRAMPKAVIESLKARVARLFPGAADYEAATFWHGFRPMTPDGPAIIRESRVPKLYLNVGHGSNGWTQGCGAAKVLAAEISGRPSPLA